jgi:hypothetical protein
MLRAGTGFGEAGFPENFIFIDLHQYLGIFENGKLLIYLK